MDTIADFLSIIKNAYLASQRKTEAPYSKMKEELGKVLVKEGFLKEVKIEGKKPQEKKLKLKLKYEGKIPVLTELKRFSKPGLRVYARANKIPRVRYGFGVTIISTSQGLLTNKEARKKGLGGEIICQVW